MSFTEKENISSGDVIRKFLAEHGEGHGVSGAEICSGKICAFVWHYEYADALPVTFLGLPVQGVVVL